MAWFRSEPLPCGQSEPAAALPTWYFDVLLEAHLREVLGFTIDGLSDMSNGKRPIRTPADVVGLKMGGASI
jgi:hypothetical protein